MNTTSTTTGPSGLAPRECVDRDLPVLIQRSREPLVVEGYFGGWEKPWRALSDDGWRELLLELGERVTGASIETGRNRELAVRYGLEVIPTVLVFLGGDVVARFTGRVKVADVLAAVRAALRQAHAKEADALELGGVSAAREQLSPRRSILRRRTSAGPATALAHAG